ncbi:thymidylate kinase [Acutalibacter sp. 1XD8-33]|uniref:dTMP kinase n=1 Tax=Acutalibacter sp. 1XD8-33 TaxID=2320081 RepID=UPI000EA3CF77|nr:thymidylate kinase [Acutalibacter sp. 1XD8-33]RKJ41354.1 thymidylate kinase [Acutalibacter sp. 1XD8-33]
MSLIVIEGLDGTGKSTQLPLLEKFLSQRGEVKTISFPDYSSPSSALVKMYLAGEFGRAPGDVNPYAAGAFYAVDRYASYQKHWRRDYEAGVTILAARYVTSNLIYQMEKLPEDQWESYIAWAEDFEYNKLGLPRPDQVILLDMPVPVSQKLLEKRYQGEAEKKDLHERNVAFLESCAACACFAAKTLGWTLVPCAENGEPLSVEKIHQRVLRALV